VPGEIHMAILKASVGCVFAEECTFVSITGTSQGFLACEWNGVLNAVMPQAQLPSGVQEMRHRSGGECDSCALALSDNRTVWLLKDDEMSRQIRRRGTTQEMAQSMLVGVDAAASKKLLGDMGNRQCQCSPPGCFVTQSSDGTSAFWCWVKGGSVDACREQGIPLMEVKGKGHRNEDATYWTKSMCSFGSRSSCKCSKAGLMPRSVDKVNKKHLGELENYGGYCSQWGQNDTAAWCYVGFISQCGDQMSSGMRPKKSRLPCDDTARGKLLTRGVARCGKILNTYRAVACFFTLLSLLVVPLVIRFLSNACRDELFEAEDQFDVVDDDDQSVAAPSVAGSDEGLRKRL